MRTLLLSISLLFIATYGFSQDSKFKFGVQAGLNYSNFRGYDLPANIEPYYSESPAFAYLGGIYIEYKIKPHLSLKVELSYERKSQKADNTVELIDFDGPVATYNYTSKKNHDYLVLPILLKYSFTEKNSFYVNGGPFIGFLLKSNVTHDDIGNGEALDTDPAETTKYYKKTDFGLSVGIGKTFDLNEKNSIFVEIRENLGLSNTTKNPVWGDGKFRTNSLNLVMGYSFN